MNKMKNSSKRILPTVFAAIIVLLAFTAMFTTASAATDKEIEDAIENGTAWLASQQDPDNGSWDGGWDIDYDMGATGLALLKLIEYAKEQGYNPTGWAYEYSDNVTMGLEFLDSHLTNVSVGTGYDGNSNGNMAYLDGFHRTYVTSIALMAYSANPDTPPDLVQDLTDWLVNAQCNDSTVQVYGVWDYMGFCCWGDNSNTGYATLGLGYALNSGATIPASTTTALSSYVDYIQNDPGAADNGTEDDPDGGSGYYSPSSWVNSLKTGNLIYEAVLSGDAVDSQRILNATDYIDRHWDDDVEGWKGNLSASPNPYNTQYQATYTIMKGFEAIGLEDLNGKDWFDEISTAIVTEQQDNGSWTKGPNYVSGGGWAYIATNELSTAWALLTLEKITPPPPNQPPNVTDAYPSIDCLWPPNHKFVDITIEGVTDPDGDVVTITITNITSDEPTASIKGAGGDKHAPDASGVGTDTASLRAERSGTGNGRVYEITFVASDGIAETVGNVTVCVPHDYRGKCVCGNIDDGQIYDATEINV